MPTAGDTDQLAPSPASSASPVFLAKSCMSVSIPAPQVSAAPGTAFLQSLVEYVTRRQWYVGERLPGKGLNESGTGG